MKKHFTFLFSTLIFAVVLCGAASAANTNVNATTETQNAINTTNNGDTLNLSTETYEEHNITVEDNLTIEEPTITGNNLSAAVIDSQELERMFDDPTEVTVTLQYLLFQNGNVTMDTANPNERGVMNMGTEMFKEGINEGNFCIIFKNSTGTVIAITETVSGNTLTLKLNSALCEAKYIILSYASSINDLLRNPVTAKLSNFREETSLNLTTIDPADQATNIPTNKAITVTFDEPIKAWNKDIQLKTSTGTIMPITTTVSGNTLTLTPTNPLASNTQYILLISKAAVTDLAGNPINSKSVAFTTGNT